MTNSKNKKNIATQKEIIAVVIISLLFGLGGGFALGINQNDTVVTPQTNTEKPTTHMSSMFEVPAENAPTVELVVSEDAKSGYNIKIITTNFTFAPEAVNGANDIGVGHAHLYVDGEKIARAYGPYFHYDGSFEGTKTFKVELNANDHSVYAVNGQPVQAEVQVTHDASDPEHADTHDEM